MERREEETKKGLGVRKETVLLSQTKQREANYKSAAGAEGRGAASLSFTHLFPSAPFAFLFVDALRLFPSHRPLFSDFVDSIILPFIGLHFILSFEILFFSLYLSISLSIAHSLYTAFALPFRSDFSFFTLLHFPHRKKKRRSPLL